MFVKKLFATNKTFMAELRNLETEITNGRVYSSYPIEPTLVCECLFFEGSTAERMVSDRYKVEVQAVLLIDPTDYTETIKEDGKVTINEKDYSIVSIENVAGQDKVIKVILKRFKNV